MRNFSPDEARENGAVNFGAESLQSDSLSQLDHPLLVEWKKHLLAEGSLAPDSARAQVRVVANFLEYVESKTPETHSKFREDQAVQNFASGAENLPGTLTHTICTQGLNHVDAYLKHLLEEKGRSPSPQASSIRTFVKWLEVKGNIDFTAKDIVTPGTKASKKLMTPSIDSWVKSEKPHENQVRRLRKFLQFVFKSEGVQGKDVGRLENLILTHAERVVPAYIEVLSKAEGATQDSIKHPISALNVFYTWAYKNRLTEFSPDLIQNPFNKKISLCYLPVFRDWEESGKAPTKIYWVKRFAAEISKSSNIKPDGIVEQKALDGIKNADEVPYRSITRLLLSDSAVYFNHFTRTIGDDASYTGKRTKASAVAVLRSFYAWAREEGLTTYTPPGRLKKARGPAKKAIKPEPSESVPKGSPATLDKAADPKTSKGAPNIGKENLKSNVQERRAAVSPLAELRNFMRFRNRAIEVLIIEEGISFSEAKRLLKRHINSDAGTITLRDKTGGLNVRELAEDTISALQNYEKEILKFPKLNESKQSATSPYFLANDGGPITVDENAVMPEREKDRELIQNLEFIRDCAVTELIKRFGSLEKVSQLALPLFLNEPNHVASLVRGSDRIVVSEGNAELYGWLRTYEEGIRLSYRAIEARGVDVREFFRSNDGGPLLADDLDI